MIHSFAIEGPFFINPYVISVAVNFTCIALIGDLLKGFGKVQPDGQLPQSVFHLQPPGQGWSKGGRS